MRTIAMAAGGLLVAAAGRSAERPRLPLLPYVLNNRVASRAARARP